ncbi:MAG: cob(I)yrinic acid a,c-diamide adenosyltransferase [Candidatus Micrarchaeota archaeon]|nr:cob(I)yrinic acid a,c-diamide adenosyltransferase [Candidatus Micrarchaeota archaeon]
MPYYTRRGDDGTSGLLGECRSLKSDLIFHAIGEVDELNSAIGIALYYTHDKMLRPRLREIQNELFVIGANLASLQSGKIAKAKFNDASTLKLESDIEEMGRRMPQLKKFVIPGGCEAAVHMHLARAIARRAERSVVAASAKHKVDPRVEGYLNRLSSYLFVAALYLNYIEGIRESHPTY